MNNQLQTTSKQAAKREATQRQLITAAFQLFKDRGFDNVTVGEIADAANVSRRTFFRYFPIKEAVVFPDNLERVEAMHRVMRAREIDTPATYQEIKDMYLKLAAGWMQNREEMISARRVIESSPTLKVHLNDIGRRWVFALAQELDGVFLKPMDENGAYLKPRLEMRIAAGAIVGAMTPVFEQWYSDDGASNLVQMGIQALDVIESGVESYLKNGR